MNPTLGWQRLQEVYYCLWPCYEDVQWPVKGLHSNHIVRLLKDASLLAVSSALVIHPSVIDIYTAAGLQVASVAYNNTPSDHIAGYAFHNENLVVVLSSGKFRYYTDLLGNFDEYDYVEEAVELVSSDLNGPENGFNEETSNNGTHNSNNNSNRSTRSDLDHKNANSHAAGSKANTSNSDSNKGYITNLETNELEQVSNIILVEIYGDILVLRQSDGFLFVDLVSFASYRLRVAIDGFHGFNVLRSSDNNGNSGPNGGLGSSDDDKLLLLVASNSTISILEINMLGRFFRLMDQGLTDGPFKFVCASPNGRFVALFNENANKIFVINSQFDQVLLEYDTSFDTPYSVAWCGNDAIILLLRDEFRLIGPGQQLISFFYDESEDLELIVPLLYTREDGLTVVTDKKIEFLGRVPECSVKLYAPGLSSPGSILLDCVDKLSQYLPKADTNITLLKSDNLLELALLECLESALVELNPVWQKKILRAVLFGKIYVTPYYDATDYLKTVLTLQVLNQLRSTDVGLFMTYTQLLNIGWEGVTNMLLRRNLHFLAIKILKIVQEEQLIKQVYLHWCCTKIEKELKMNDLELFKLIAGKLQGKLISLQKISEVALQEGRINLCRMLVNLEPLISQKILSFVKLGDLELALISAFQSGDYDLCKLILLYLYKTLSKLQFYKVLNQNEQIDILVDDSVDPETKLKKTRNLFVHGDLITSVWNQINKSENSDPTNLGKSNGRDKVTTDSNLPVYKPGIDVQQFYTEYKSKLMVLINSSSRYDAKEYQQELQLLETKKKLEETFHDESFFSKKLIIEILRKLIEMNQLKPASKLSKEFKVSIEKYWFLVLNILSQNGEFERLHTFILGNSNGRTDTTINSPIGFKPIVERCILKKAPKKYINVYINNCTNLHYLDKVEFFAKNDDYVAAATEAFRHKDGQALNSLLQRSSANDAQVIRDYIQRLR